MGVTQFGVAVPNFWFAIILVWIFAVILHWFSAGGFPGWDKGPGRGCAADAAGDRASVPQASILARVMRSSLLDTLGEDYIRTARAHGEPWASALGHALRNALIPVLTIVGLQFAFLLPGHHHRERVLPAGTGAAGVPGHHAARFAWSNRW